MIVSLHSLNDRLTIVKYTRKADIHDASNPYPMETIIQHLTEHMAAVTWLDFVDTAILIGMGAYGLYRIESKVNPLVDQVNALTQSNKQALDIIDKQDAELKQVRKKYQALHDRIARQVVPDPDAVWQDWPRNN